VPYSVRPPATSFAALLHEHISGAVRLVLAVEGRRRRRGGRRQGRWYANGQAIAEFLAAANPRSGRWTR